MLENNAQNASDPRTLRRGLAVLAALLDHGHVGLSVTDIARITTIQRPTVYRLLAALIEADLVASIVDTKKYRSQLRATSGEHIVDVRIHQTLSSLQRLATLTGDAVFLMVRDGDDSISLHREIGGYSMQILATYAYAGKRQPLRVGHGLAG